MSSGNGILHLLVKTVLVESQRRCKKSNPRKIKFPLRIHIQYSVAKPRIILPKFLNSRTEISYLGKTATLLNFENMFRIHRNHCQFKDVIQI